MKPGGGLKRTGGPKRNLEKARAFEQRARDRRRERSGDVKKTRKSRGRRDRIRGMSGWLGRVRRLHGRWCLVCYEERASAGERPRKAVHGHHVVPCQVILDDVRKVKGLREALCRQAANALPVCHACHHAHESAMRRIPRAIIRPITLVWAELWGFTYDLERLYPAT